MSVFRIAYDGMYLNVAYVGQCGQATSFNMSKTELEGAINDFVKYYTKTNETISAPAKTPVQLPAAFFDALEDDIDF